MRGAAPQEHALARHPPLEEVPPPSVDERDAQVRQIDDPPPCEDAQTVDAENIDPNSPPSTKRARPRQIGVCGSPRPRDTTAEGVPLPPRGSGAADPALESDSDGGSGGGGALAAVAAQSPPPQSPRSPATTT